MKGTHAHLGAIMRASHGMNTPFEQNTNTMSSVVIAMLVCCVVSGAGIMSFKQKYPHPRQLWVLPITCATAQ